MIRVNAGIVLYNPDIKRLQKNIESIWRQVENVILVDNGSKSVNDIISILSKYPNTILIRNKENEGIARALNQICLKTEEQDIPWVITLDQDSICPDGLITSMMSYSANEEIGIICPAVYYEGLNVKKQNQEETEYVYACMTSASLTRLKAWKMVHGFQEDYFIDFVDNDFCMKLKLAGYKILRVNKCILHHQLGESHVRKFFYGKIKVCYTKHQPWRFYYMIRNNLYFIHKYRRYLNVIKEYFKVIYIAAKGLLFADEKSNTLLYICRGYRDARNNKLGKMI